MKWHVNPFVGYKQCRKRQGHWSRIRPGKLLCCLKEKGPLAQSGCIKSSSMLTGTVERFKERVVVKGYNQLKGVDYDQSLSLVNEAVTVRVFFFGAAMKA